MKNRNFFIIRVVQKIYVWIIRNTTTIKIIYKITKRGENLGVAILGKG